MGVNIKFKQVYKYYNSKQALNNISFEICDNEIVGVIGFSGSGKSTLVNLLLNDNDYLGEILYDEKPLNDYIRSKYNISMVFDTSICLNHLNVYDNIKLGLEYLKLSEKQIKDAVVQVADQLEISDKLYVYPNQLSAGQKQRVSIARALCRKCDILLMDEPFSNLDIVLKYRLLKLIKSLQQSMNFTCVFVTHDLNELKNIVDKVLVLNDSNIQCFDTFNNILNNCDNELIKLYKSEVLN